MMNRLLFLTVWLVLGVALRAGEGSGAARLIEINGAIGPSTASTTSASVIAAGGRARRTPPPVPRLDSSRPAADSRLTSFCAVGRGMPVSAESVVAFILAAPQWRAAADISTTA